MNRSLPRVPVLDFSPHPTQGRTEGLTTSLCRKVAGLWNPADLGSNSALTQSNYTLEEVPPASVSPRVLGVEAPASRAVARKTNGMAGGVLPAVSTRIPVAVT